MTSCTRFSMPCFTRSAVSSSISFLSSSAIRLQGHQPSAHELPCELHLCHSAGYTWQRQLHILPTSLAPTFWPALIVTLAMAIQLLVSHHACGVRRITRCQRCANMSRREAKRWHICLTNLRLVHDVTSSLFIHADPESVIGMHTGMHACMYLAFSFSYSLPAKSAKAH